VVLQVVDALVLEWLPHGELFSYLVKTALPERIARRMFRQVLAAVQHCHDCGVFHRDVKPENVMFSSDFDPVLVDFGFAVQAADVAPRPCTPCTPVEPASPHVGDASDSDGRRSSDMALRGCGSPKGRSAPLVSTQVRCFFCPLSRFYQHATPARASVPAAGV
jgi:serine/threonine protein kinase